MKKPDLKTVPVGTPETSFTEQAKAVQKKASASEKAVKRSFSLMPIDTAYIDKQALQRGQERGKSMTASEALRLIIEEHRGQA